jgi:hypothetical protein
MPENNQTNIIPAGREESKPESLKKEITAESCGAAIVCATQKPATEKEAPRKRRRRKKRIRISDALRREGLDEREVAKKLKSVIERQIPEDPDEEANDKLLADMLMNCFRYLDETPRPGGAAGAPGSGSAPAKLIHDIPRPQRAAKIKQEEQKGSQQ